MMFWYLPGVLFSWFFVISLISAVILGSWVIYKLKRHIRLSFRGTIILLLCLIIILTHIFIRTLIALSTVALILIIALVVGAIIHIIYMISISKPKK